MDKPKVFIVDDDPSFVKLLKHQLEAAKITPIETYESGEECLANMHHRPKLVLLDFSMVGLNGLDVLTKIKEDFPRTAVVMLTAVEDADVERRCLEAGASSYIRKDPDGVERLKKDIFPKYNRSGFFSWFN